MQNAYRILTALLFALSCLQVSAQPSPVLEGYIRQGLSNNLALKQPQFAFEKSLIALKEASGLFLPTAAFDFQYTLATGGRTIDFPIGDLLNPVYQTLNQLTDNNRFPTIANETIQFLPNNFHTTRIVVTHPLLNAEIYYNQKIRREMISYQQAEVNAYKRELVKQIKIAYFRYLQAGKAAEVYQSALQLVQENLKLNEKLVKNQVALSSNVYRSRAEVSKMEAQLAEAENNRKLAAYAFNTLLNQPFEAPIQLDTAWFTAPIDRYDLMAPDDETYNGRREELLKLSSALRANEHQLRMHKSYVIPTIGHSLEGGYQGFGLNYNSTQDYMLYGISLKWNLFNGFRNQLKIRQSLLDRQGLEAQKRSTEQQIALQIQSAQRQMDTAEKALQSAKEALANSEEFFRIVNARYREGQALLIEFLDARNQLTSAQIGYTVARFGVFIRAAEKEQATAGYPLE